MTPMDRLSLHAFLWWAAFVPAGLVLLAGRSRRRRDQRIAAARAQAKVAFALALTRAEGEYLDWLEREFSAEGSEA